MTEVTAGGWQETMRILAVHAFRPHRQDLCRHLQELRPFLGTVSAIVLCPQSSDRSPSPPRPTWVTGSGAGLTASSVGPRVTVCAGQPWPLQASRPLTGGVDRWAQGHRR